MWWKTVIKWLRDRVDVDVDVDLDLGDGTVAVGVVVRFNDAVLLSERFEWPVPSTGKPARLLGRSAKRSRVVPDGA